MRVTRGLFASLGAGGTITAAGAVALLVLSTVIGVRGWPGLVSVRLAPKTLVVADQDAAAPREQLAGRPSTRRVGHLLAATEPAPRPAPAGVGAPARVTTPTPAPVHVQASRPAPPQPSAPAATSAPSAAGAPPAPPTAPVADAVRQTGDAAGTAVTQVTDTVAGVVEDADGLLKP